MPADKAKFERELNLVKNIKNLAQEVLINHSWAIENLTNFAVYDFEASVQEIYPSKGRDAVTSIGKSSLIANKIVATLKSTSTTA